MEKIEISLSSYDNNNNLKRPTEQKHFVDMPNHFHCIADCFFECFCSFVATCCHPRAQTTNREKTERTII